MRLLPHTRVLASLLIRNLHVLDGVVQPGTTIGMEGAVVRSLPSWQKLPASANDAKPHKLALIYNRVLMMA